MANSAPGDGGAAKQSWGVTDDSPLLGEGGPEPNDGGDRPAQLTQGFAICDKDERIVSFDEGCLRLFPDISEIRKTGGRFPDLLRRGVATGRFPDAKGREEVWLIETALHHSSRSGPYELRCSDGRVLLVAEHPLSDDQRIIQFRDVTALNEAEQTARRRDETARQLAVENAGLKAETAALRADMAGFRDLSDISFDWQWQTDEDHRFIRLVGHNNLEVRGALERVLGKTRWEAVGADPETSEYWARHKADLEAYRPFQRFRYETTAATGERLYIVASGKPLFDESGRFLGYRGTAADETVAVEALRRAEQTDAQLQRVADNVPGFIYQAVVGADLTLRYTYISSGVREMCGLEPDDVVRDGTLLRRLIHPDDTAARDDFTRRQLAERSSRPVSAELRYNTPHHGARWVRFITRPRQLPDGTTLWDGLTIDIHETKEAELALREREEQLRGIADNLPGFIYQALSRDDGTYDFVFVSSAAQELFGIPAEELTDGSAFARLVHPDDRAARAAALRRAVQDGTVLDMELRVVTPHKGTRWLKVVSKPRRFEGQRRLWDGVMLDITDAKHAELALREREEQLSGIANNLPGFVYQILSQPNGSYRFIYLSPGTTDLVGIAPDDLLRDSSLFAALIDPADRRRRDAALIAATRDGTAFEIELRLHTPHKGLRWVKVLSKPRRIEDSQLLWDGVVLDITDTKRAEIALRQREEQLRGLTDSLPGFVCQLLTQENGSYIFTYVSSGSSEALGITAEALMENSALYSALIHPDDKDRRNAALVHSTRTGNPFEIEVRMCTPHKGVRWVKVWGKPGRIEEEGRLWDGLVLDITDAKNAELALRERDDRLRGIADNLTGFVFQNAIREDGSYDFLYVSSGSRRLIDVDAEALVRDSSLYTDLIHPEDKPGRDAALLQSLQDGVPYELEWRLRTPHRGDRWVKIIVTPGRFENGRRICDGIVLDVHEAKIAELALRERDQQLRGIADNLPGFIFQNIVRDDGTYDFVYVSSGAEELTGIAPEELMRDSSLYTSLIHPDDRADRDAAMARSIQEHESFALEWRLRTPHKGVRWVKVVVRPARKLPDGRQLWDGLVLDITETKLAEEALRERDDQLRRISDNLPGFIFQNIVRPGNTYDFTYVSSGAEKLTSYSPQELMRDSRLYLDLIHPEDRAQRDSGLMRDIGDGDQYEIEWRLRTPHRGVRWVKVALTSTALGDGRRVCDGIVLDITEAKHAELALRERDDQLRGIADNLPGFLYQAACNEDGLPRFIFASEGVRELCGIEPDALVRDSSLLDAMVYPEDRAQRLAALTSAGRDAAPFDIEARLQTPKGLRWTRSAARPRRMADGVIVWDGLLLDITALKEAQTALIATGAALQQAQKMEAIGRLTGGMAHDFNNLLGVVIGNLDLLREMRKDDVAGDELASDALSAAVRGADLTRRLLAFSRQQPLQTQRIEVNLLVTNITRLLSRVLGEQVQIELQLGAEVWPIVVDPAQLESALTNLSTNARDAMPHGGRLIFTTGNRSLDADYAALHAEVTPGDYALIQVGDTGGGMPPEVVARIFEPFFTTKGPGKGTGLGLSMVFGFIKQSGGHVEVASEPGRGTTFSLYLPRVPEATARAGQRIAEQAAGGNGETVLTVEDNTFLSRVVGRQLTELGYRVLEADNAAAGLAILEHHDVDLLLTDIVMPGGIDGIELAQQVYRRWPGTRVVLTTGFTEQRQDGDIATLLPGTRMLVKPYRKADLAAVLRAVLDRPPP